MSKVPNIDSLYSDHGSHYHEGVHHLLPGGEVYISKIRSEKIQSFINESDIVFEYGVGQGWNLASLRAAFKEGYDLYTPAGITENYKINLIKEISNDLQNKYDTVICSHVLEHVINPAETLNLLHGVLKPEGKLILFVPYENQRRLKQYIPNEKNHHLFSWNPQTLGALLSVCKFNIFSVKLKKFGYERYFANLCVKFKLPYWVYKMLIRLALLLRPEYEIMVVAQRIKN